MFTVPNEVVARLAEIGEGVGTRREDRWLAAAL